MTADQDIKALTAASSGELLTVKIEDTNPLRKLLILLRQQVSIEDLIANRLLMAIIDRELNFHFTQNQEHVEMSSEILVSNPYPEVKLRKDNFDWKIKNPFMLKDGEYFYYFEEEWPTNTNHLRTEDIIELDWYGQSYPPEVIEKIKTDLGINEDTINHLIFLQDNRITSYSVHPKQRYTKTLNRVSIYGGVAERYNYTLNEGQGGWEENGHGEYKINIFENLRRHQHPL